MLQEKIQERVPERAHEPARVPPRTFNLAPPPQDDPRVDLKELIRVIQRRRKSILWTAAVPVVLALLYGLFATPLYTASTQILIDPRDRRIVSNEVTPEGLAPDGGVAVVESQMLVVTSDMVLRRVIKTERLDSDPEFGGPSVGIAALARNALSSIGVSFETPADPELNALRQLKRRIGTKRSDKAFVVDVFVTTESRGKAVRIADSIAQSYLDDQAEARSSGARRASVALGARLDALRKRVQDAEDQVVRYKQDNKLIAASGVLVTDQQLSEMTLQLNAAHAKTAEARARHEQIVRASKSGIEAGAMPEAVLSQTIGQLRTQYAEVARRRAELGAIVGPKHPSLVNLDAQIKDVQKLINEELSRIAAAAKSDVERNQASQQALETELEALKQRSVVTSQASVQLRELEREVEASRGVYQAFLTRARETGEQQTIDNSNARIISKATEPRDKSWPPRFLLLAVALAGGLGLGTGVGLMREYFDESVYSARTLASVTGVPVLAETPLLAQRAGRWSIPSVRSRQRQHGQDGTRSQTTQLIAAMRRMRDTLFDGNRPQPTHTLAITSAVAGEGRTTIALNLAVTAASDGWRVLLVDADIRRGMLSKILDATSNAGLFDVLEGRGTLNSVALSDTETRLSFLPLGNATSTNIPSAKEISEKLRSAEIDLVIVDTSATLDDPYTRAFADAVNDIVFVVRAGATKRAEIEAGIDALRQNARKLRGAVLAGTTDA